MTQIKVDNIADAAGTGAPDFEDGLTVAGSAISTLNTAEYYESGTEPSSPKNGAIWKDTANDKLMMYIAGEFKEIELGASAGGLVEWTVDISNITYDNVSFSVAGQDVNPREVAFNTDGTKMYMVGGTSDSVHQYSLSTGFDLSTASYDSVSFSVASQDTSPYSVAFSTDGAKMYVVGNPTGTIYQYTLSTGFDLSTASYDSVSFSSSGQESSPRGVAFNTDGTKMYMVGSTSDSVHQYSLSTGFDLSTASYDSVSFSVASQDTSPYSVAFSTDGAKMYVVGNPTGTIYQYTLSTGFDLSTASYNSVSSSVASQDSSPHGTHFSADGTKMYMVGTGSDSVHQYSTGL